MIVINLFGGPGSGKSTVASGLFYEMKRRHYNVELAPEYAKDLVFSQTLMLTPQEYIFAEQLRRIQILDGKADFAICDCPILLSHTYYIKYYGTKNKNADAFLNYVIATFKSYENFNVMLQRPNVFTEKGRIQNLEQSKEIDDAIESSLRVAQVPYVHLQTDDTIIDRIMGYYPFSAQ